MEIRYANRNEYRMVESEWAANLIACNIMRNDARVSYIKLLDNQGQLKTTYKRRES